MLFLQMQKLNPAAQENKQSTTLAKTNNGELN